MIRYLLAAGGLILCNCCGAQTTQRTEIDTIFAETVDKIYIYFENDIRFVDVGSGKQDFAASFTTNCVLIKAVHDKARPTSLMIDYTDGYYHGTLAYKKGIAQKDHVIDFREKPRDSIPHFINEHRAVTRRDPAVDQSVVAERLDLMQSTSERHLKPLTRRRYELTFSLTDIRRDDGFLYLRFFVRNASKQDYKVHLFDFSYLDDPEGEAGRIPRFVKAVDFGSISNSTKVSRGHVEYFVFAIPYFALTPRGQLNIAVHEKEGSRMMSLKVGAKLIINAETF